jgi:putative DNA methylase
VRSLPLPFENGLSEEIMASRSALESPTFPFEAISRIAEQESWRKEVNRPIYHVHKWWAQRLGSVFRAMTIGAFSAPDADVLARFYSPSRFPGKVVFDPFMGSGTTLGEALKLGCRAIGRDINPVAAFLVRNALERHSRAAIQAAFQRLSDTVRLELEPYYRCTANDGTEATVLYFFWTKVLPCPQCETAVDLMSRRIFAQHAYPKRYPRSQSLCPDCGQINVVNYDATDATCRDCGHCYNPKSGPAKGTKATCPSCAHEFPIAATARARGEPPEHRLYAKLALTRDGEKEYLKADDRDLTLYKVASERLKKEKDLFPVVRIAPGYNTNQVLNYGYTHWHQMFNDRQLLSLGLLGRAIQEIEAEEVRDALICLFSGSLEFNNMFASYKGEGTGAVRHMFYHHILKPERTPLEANLWGTSKSSGSFSGMFKSRLLRALDYAADPFELSPGDGKIYGLSAPIGAEAAGSYGDFAGKALYVSCGDSSTTDLESDSVDAVITDPPFFDNVNYSQLADFFHVWQRHLVGRSNTDTTRSDEEVQHQDAEVFSERLAGVLSECHRVLKSDGLLAFSYHHSRSEGWSSVLAALTAAGFVVTASFPVKAEMSGAAPKNQAKEPIDVDIILVCRKRSFAPDQSDASLDVSLGLAASQISRFHKAGRKLSRNDVRVILMGQLLRCASSRPDQAHLLRDSRIERWIGELAGT